MSDSQQIEFAAYIIERIKQAGVKQIFGVPGDYNLEFLDYFERDPVLKWVGNANELNAAYAADGYARIKGGLAVIVTTFGVGELSALCGVAGSLAERLPVLHIVGAPSTKMQKDNALLHHTLNTPTSFSAFADMSAPLSCAQALLNEVIPDTDTSYTRVFDDALRACLTQCRPAYVELPMDAVRALVSSKSLELPLPTPHSAPPFDQLVPRANPGSAHPVNSLYNLAGDHQEASSDVVINHVVALITKLFSKADRPVILVDACCGRFGMRNAVRALVETCGIRYFSTPMGKTLLDEHHPLFGGCYAGSNSLGPVKAEVEAADFVLYVGSLKSDFNSGSFSVHVDDAHTVKLHSYQTVVGYASFPTADIRHVLPRLLPTFAEVIRSQGSYRKAPHMDSLETKIKEGRVLPFIREPKLPDGEIVQAWLWGRMASWFKDNDIIIAETGTSSFGMLNYALPSHSHYVAQVLWGAIGWSVGACLGAALAAQEGSIPRRTALFVGDGSLQLTVQEIGTMVRRGVMPYLFVLNNDGYEIERQIHGPKAQYNDIQSYDHQMLLPFFGGKNPATPCESHIVRTQAELNALLNNPVFNIPDKLRLIELVMPRDDAPAGLVYQTKLTAKANAGEDV